MIKIKKKKKKKKKNYDIILYYIHFYVMKLIHHSFAYFQ